MQERPIETIETDMAPADGKLEYQIIDENNNITTVPATPNNGETDPDPLTLARTRLKQLQMTRRLLSLMKRERIRRVEKRNQLARRRKANRVAKASRKRNR